MLSRDQFKGLAGRLNEPDGGFSVRTTSGFEPSSGYMVSRPGTERTYEYGHTPVTENELQDYTTTHHDVLSRPSHYFGGWHDPGPGPTTGNRDLDISRRYGSFTRGVAAMIGGGQRAMYDLNRWRSVRNVSQEGAPALGIEPDKPEEYAEMQKHARAFVRHAPAQPPEFLRSRGRR